MDRTYCPALPAGSLRDYGSLLIEWPKPLEWCVIRIIEYLEINLLTMLPYQ